MFAHSVSELHPKLAGKTASENVVVFSALLGPSVDTRSCVSLRDIWSTSLVVLARVSGSHLYFSVLEKSTVQWFWEITSGCVVFRASWFDSGYRCMPVVRLRLLFPYSAQCLVLCGTSSASVSVLGKVVVLVLRNDRDMVIDSAESRAGAAFAVYRRSLLPFVPQRQIPMVLLVQKTTETLQLSRWSMPLLCLPLLCTTGRVPARCCARQRFRRFSTFLANLVFIWGVTEVLCAVTDQGPRILLDFLCASGGVSQLVPTSSGYTWISRELHAVHIMLVPSLGVGFLGALCTGTGLGEACPQGHGPHN